ncbi:MAG TPA: hypothetical protein VJ831_16020 [Jatrophihabitantaceae bacterium]|nr:hypothetical protein [Jatrophihabitantaceae bacterium]
MPAGFRVRLPVVVSTVLAAAISVSCASVTSGQRSSAVARVTTGQRPAVVGSSPSPSHRVASAGAHPGTVSSQTVRSAAAYAHARGFDVGICVIDLRTGNRWSANGDALFATESVAKLFIAARLLLERAMTATTAGDIARMITRSDDELANRLAPLVGNDAVMPWLMDHYRLPHLGTPPTRFGWWGLNHVRPDQLARLLVDLHQDPAVWPRLGSAMRHASRYAADGYDQSFGLRQVDRNAAVKQGWGYDFSMAGAPAQLNTTGFVDSGRYAVVIMVRGRHDTFFDQIAEMVTDVTKRVFSYA